MAKVKITGHASGTGVITVTAPNTSTDRTITLPDSSGTLLEAGTAATILGVGTASDAQFESIRGGDLTTASASIVWNTWTNMIQLSSLDGGYTYIGESYVNGYKDTGYSVTFLFRPSFQGTGTSGLVFLADGGNYSVQITGGYLQAKDNSSGGTNSHTMTVRKLIKDVDT